MSVLDTISAISRIMCTLNEYTAISLCRMSDIGSSETEFAVVIDGSTLLLVMDFCASKTIEYLFSVFFDYFDKFDWIASSLQGL